MSRVFIGLGGNLDRPEQHVTDALVELGQLPRTRLVRHSSLYRSRPLGPPGQPDYVNAVAEIDTELEPEQLLDALQSIEAAHGRVRDGTRWGPRTLDLDLLLFGRRRLHSPRLTVPHPQMTHRNFVLCPLLEIAPDAEIPGVGAAAPILERLGNAGLERVPRAGA